MRALNLAQSISGALHRVSNLRSPSSGEVPGRPGQGLSAAGSSQLAAVQEAGSPSGTERGPGGITSDSIPLAMFSCPGAAGFKVRGPTYLQDKKKVSLPSYYRPRIRFSLPGRSSIFTWILLPSCPYFRVALEPPLIHASVFVMLGLVLSR